MIAGPFGDGYEEDSQNLFLAVDHGSSSGEPGLP